MHKTTWPDRAPAQGELREIIHGDFFGLTRITPQLTGYDAYFFCLGVSSVGVDLAQYKRVTQDRTLGFAQVLAKTSPATTFCYVTGRSTDSTEQRRIA